MYMPNLYSPPILFRVHRFYVPPVFFFLHFLIDAFSISVIADSVLYVALNIPDNGSTG